jgi:hypothetical protein
MPRPLEVSRVRWRGDNQCRRVLDPCRTGGSCIDHTLLRDKDTDNNGVPDERIYYVHNWRNDVVALLTDAGEQVESVR